MKGWFGLFVEETKNSIHIVKMYKDKEVNKKVALSTII
jgi:RNase P/RNase MRP subunit p29